MADQLDGIRQAILQRLGVAGDALSTINPGVSAINKGVSTMQNAGIIPSFQQQQQYAQPQGVTQSFPQLPPEALLSTAVNTAQDLGIVQPPPDANTALVNQQVQDFVKEKGGKNQKTDDSNKSKSFDFGALAKLAIPGIAAGIGMGVPGALPGAAGFATGFTKQQAEERKATLEKELRELDRQVKLEDKKIKNPSWKQQQKVKSIKSGILNGKVVLGKEFGEPSTYDVKSMDDALAVISEAGLDPKMFEETLKQKFGGQGGGMTKPSQVDSADWEALSEEGRKTLYNRFNQ